jgi:hypothetical protein
MVNDEVCIFKDGRALIDIGYLVYGLQDVFCFLLPTGVFGRWRKSHEINKPPMQNSPTVGSITH